MEYDWRTRFREPLTIVGAGMAWGEAARLVRILRADPSSMLAASMEGWEHPISREALVLMDLFDLEHAVNSKKTPAPHWMRPEKPKNIKRYGDTGGRSRAEVVAILNAHGHNLPV